MNASGLDSKTITRTANALIDDHLRTGRTLCFQLSTSSMWPALAVGDRVYVRAARIDELRPGDILVRRMETSWVAHRLIHRVSLNNETWLVTKGDNALMADAIWPAAQLAGVVVAVERAARQPAVPLTQGRWQARLIAMLSRGQLLTNGIEPALFRRVAIKISRACLRAAVRFAG